MNELTSNDENHEPPAMEKMGNDSLNRRILKVFVQNVERKSTRMSIER